MNEVVRKVFIYGGILILVFLAGAVGGYFSRAGEIREAITNISETERVNERLGAQLATSWSRIGELEKIQSDRDATIKELRADLRHAMGTARERDKVVARLERRLNSLAAGSGEYGDLAKEGERIVKELLEE